ncbi:hypothetical protein ABBQ38_006249 [Trebouxia sp. C0009 RCD-2024]
MDHRLYVTTLSKFDSRKREGKPDKLGTATQCMVLGLSASGIQLIQNTHTGQQHIVSLGVWGWGQQPGHQLVVRQASQRLRLIQAGKHGILAPGTLTCQPRLLPSLGSDLTPAEVLQALESRWTASMQASPASRARLSSDMPTSQPAWMALTRGHRQHWSQRQQQQQAQQQQQPSQQPNQPHIGRATIHDTVDVLAPLGSHPQLTEWRRLWELASAAYFNRQHRVLWWRILHGV